MNDSLKISVSVQDEAPFIEWIQVLEIKQDNGDIRLAASQRHDFNNRHGVVHGGILATLLDSAMARAARALEGVHEIAGTVDIHVQYLRPATGEIVAIGHVEHTSTALAFCRGEIRNSENQSVALASGTFRLRRMA